MAPNQAIADSIKISAGDVAVRLMWRRTKIVYDIDPTLMRSLIEMDTTDALPGEVLRQLPHPNPMFVFTEGHPFLHKDGASAVLRAMQVTGRRQDGVLCSTHAEEAGQYQLTFISDILDDKGAVKDIDSVRVSIELDNKSFTIRKMIDDIMEGYAWEPLLASSATEADKRSYLEQLAGIGIAHLLYVCSDKADTVRRPVGRKPVKKGGQRPPKPVQLHQVGYRIGPAIKSAHERIERERAEGVRTGRKMIPHVRKAHLHTFRHGKGRALSKVKWLPPIFVNASGEQLDLNGVIIPVQR
ncbi:hypothetical protein [Streptomyces sp. NPDC017448]|uniref:hypothetical protein n=1 Tax=Streptomyces sp. NPDC017448 TaxID=3364996 RepID=UPI0037B5E0D8